MELIMTGVVHIMHRFQDQADRIKGLQDYTDKITQIGLQDYADYKIIGLQDYTNRIKGLKVLHRQDNLNWITGLYR